MLIEVEMYVREADSHRELSKRYWLPFEATEYPDGEVELSLPVKAAHLSIDHASGVAELVRIADFRGQLHESIVQLGPVIEGCAVIIATEP